MGEMKSVLNGVIVTLAPVSIIKGTMSGVRGVVVPWKVDWKAARRTNFSFWAKGVSVEGL
jgi:hypothetical protein